MNSRPPITGDEYQIRAMATAAPGSDITTAALGLAGEAGEFCDAVKKWRSQGHDLDQDALVKECSDIIWYCALACQVLGVKMSDVMQQNLDKLAKRYKSGFTAEESRNRVEYQKDSSTTPGGVSPSEDRFIETGYVSGEDGKLYPGESMFGSADSAQDAGGLRVDPETLKHTCTCMATPVGAVVDFAKMNGADDLAYFRSDVVRAVTNFLAGISDEEQESMARYAWESYFHEAGLPVPDDEGVAAQMLRTDPRLSGD